MKYSVGTPPSEVFGIVDTGSDLIWSQCKPCNGCYAQRPPLFDPKNSSAYQDLSCGTTPFTSLPSDSCNKAKVCTYSYLYGDDSFTKGFLATDTVTLDLAFGGYVQFPMVVIGCENKNAGIFSEDTSGIVGLGPGPLSLVSQLESAVSRKFSCCLVPFRGGNFACKINFGSSVVVSGSGAVTTPLDDNHDENYYVTLKGLSVGTTDFLPAI
ncbi:Xylanase inhibitor, N-terminal [Dillenia turbinata]|uniref:Xylanase inhibitor, N-terminal n=1 Tax=Dillenia turbinata TaxID=194707 RepID=A0AAN8W6Z8_9MAGN